MTTAYFILIVMTATGLTSTSIPLPSEQACETVRAAVLAGHELLREKGHTPPTTIVGCVRVPVRPEVKS